MPNPKQPDPDQKLVRSNGLFLNQFFTENPMSPLVLDDSSCVKMWDGGVLGVFWFAIMGGARGLRGTISRTSFSMRIEW